jgi:NAD dependent epimerase/dehydratase family enzyme
MSWISITDAVRAILFAAEKSSLLGPINLTAPDPVTNEEFTITLARVLKRPAAVPLPQWLLDLTLGQVARETLLVSSRVLPGRLQAAGFTFEHSRLEFALRSLLKE